MQPVVIYLVAARIRKTEDINTSIPPLNRRSIAEKPCSFFNVQSGREDLKLVLVTAQETITNRAFLAGIRKYKKSYS